MSFLILVVFGRKRGQCIHKYALRKVNYEEKYIFSKEKEGEGWWRGAGAWASVSHWDWRVCLHVPGTMCEPVAQGTVRVPVLVGRRRWAWLARHVLTVLPASTGVSG